MGEVWKGLLCNEDKAGKQHRSDATISPMLDPNENITGFVAVKRDSTEKLALEKQLRPSQKMEVVGTLTGWLAQFLQTLLTGISWHLIRLIDELLKYTAMS